MNKPNPTYSINKYKLFRTSEYYPEQYDIYYGSSRVGYVRLRGGMLTVDALGVDGQMAPVLLECFPDDLKGQFSNEDERIKSLTSIIQTIDSHRKDMKRCSAHKKKRTSTLTIERIFEA